MASSGLKARLKAISSAAAGKPPAPAYVSHLRFEKSEEDAPPALAELSPGALRRIGVDFNWPGIERCLFLDTETTGLSGGAGTLCFMIGLGYLRQGRFVVEQCTLGDYPDEPEALLWLARMMERFDALISFNGRAFDLPLLANRFTMAALRDKWPRLPHLDLLPPSRRLWKKRLKSCRLSVLEEQVLRRGRTDDLPGAEAPRRFFSYLKCGDATLMDDVLRHNRLDILSLGALLAELCEAYGKPESRREAEDLLSLGRAFERRGERSEAAKCYHLASLPEPALTIRQLRRARFAREAQWNLALLRKREGASEVAEAIFKRLADEGAAEAMVEMAKICEHGHHDLEAALLYTERALSIRKDAREREALINRRARLRGKLERRAKKR